MLNEICLSLGTNGIILAVALVCVVLCRGRVRFGWLAAAVAALLAHDMLLTRFFWTLPSWSIDTTWNWSGKILATVPFLLLAATPALGWRRVGLTLRQDPEHVRGALILSGVLVAVFLGLALYFPGGGDNAEAFAFQLTMPGLEEELFFRGVLLLMFNEAFGRPVRILGARMGWGALLTSLAFGLMHGLDYGADGFSLNAVALTTTGLSALLLVWLREKSGSLLLPFLLHTYGNVIFMFV